MFLDMRMVERSGRAVIEAEAVNVILAIWLVVSPFVLGLSHNIALTCSNIAVGIALILVEVATELGGAALQALVVPLGVWLFASPFVLGFPNAGFLANNIILAFVTIAVGAIRDGL